MIELCCLFVDNTWGLCMVLGWQEIVSLDAEVTEWLVQNEHIKQTEFHVDNGIWMADMC